MEITPQSRWRLRLQNVVFIVLFLGIIGLAAWLSTLYAIQADWTAGNRNTLSEESQELLTAIDEPIEFVAFVPDDAPLRQRIQESLTKYRRFKPSLDVSFSNPDLEPERAREAGITRAGQMLVRVGSRTEVVNDMSEQTLANALQRLARDEERWVLFLQGHGERDLSVDINQGYSRLNDSLTRSGIQVQTLNLIREPKIPENTSLLVIASPQSALLKGEVAKLREYVSSGGNLLWLRDPKDMAGLESLADELGVDFVEGVAVDANPELRALLGIQHPAVVPVVDYSRHPITRDLNAQTLFPFAAAAEAKAGIGWSADPILTTLARTWSETGSLSGEEITFSSKAGDRAGPLNIGLALSRDMEDVQQRAVVIGDSDFLANGYIGNGDNLELGINLFNWLIRDDELISINPTSAPDTELVLTNSQIFAIAFTFLTVLPVGLAVTGVIIWLKRRRR